MQRIEERSRDIVWDVERARHWIAVKRWRGLSNLPVRLAR
jgi:hypothetical protein